MPRNSAVIKNVMSRLEHFPNFTNERNKEATARAIMSNAADQRAYSDALT